MLFFSQNTVNISLIPNSREDIRESIVNGPYWTSDLNCTGTEEKLGDCGKTELGAVTTCESRHYAGVVCYDKDGKHFAFFSV